MRLTKISLIALVMVSLMLTIGISEAAASRIEARFDFEVTDKTVQFVDESIGVPYIVSWSWDFGDNNWSKEKEPTHTYAGYGEYRVTLRITSVFGNVSTETEDVEILRPGTVAGVNQVLLWSLLIFELGSFLGAIVVRNRSLKVICVMMGLLSTVLTVILLGTIA
jgi:hypothetical protein